MTTGLDSHLLDAEGFAHDASHLQQIASEVLHYARARGANASEIDVSEGSGQTIVVRQGTVETIEYNRDKSIGITVYLGCRRGHASTSDFSSSALRAAADAALSIARFTAEDPYAGLADANLLAREVPDLDLFHPWALSVEDAIDLAKNCEDAALSVDKRITNSEGATVSTQQSHFVYANSLGFMGGYPASRHWISCAVIAGQDEQMQRDDWYAIARDPNELEAAVKIGKTAGERALRRLGARKIATAQAPVIFEGPIAATLLGHFVAATSGGALYRKSSFLLDSLGRQVFAPTVQIVEDSRIPKGLASAPFDDEGVATACRPVVENGVVCGYFLGSYSARKLGLSSTGNAGGNHNLILRDTGDDLASLLKKTSRGLFVTELLGHGVNTVTGDYSRGAAGFWIEDGVIVHPVEEITIAGNLSQMFHDIVAVGTDVNKRGSKQCGSILISGMTIAGS